MAILNIKNFPDALYARLRERAGVQHRSVAQEVTHILEAVLTEPEPRSILELKGLGKEIWAETDSVSHVEREREAWD